MRNLNRREFVAAASLAAAACLSSFACPALVRADEAASKTVDIGAKSDYAKDGITSTWINSDNVVVVRTGGKVLAFTAVCTHKGVTIAATGDTLTCPKHHSIFNIDGTPKSGKATTPLLHYAVSVNDKGHIIVDKSKTFDQDKWGDAASFVAV